MKRKVEFDHYSERYCDEIGEAVAFTGKGHDFFLRVKIDWLLKTVTGKLAGNTLKMLDVGCGHGLYHSRLVESGRVDLHGVDPAEKVIEMAKSANPAVSYKVNDGKTLFYSDGEFDVCFALCVFHHVPPEARIGLLSEMVRVTRKGGLVVIFEHNPLNPLTVRIVNSCPLDRNAKLLRSGELKAISEKLGFSKVRTDYLMFFPFDGQWFRVAEGLMSFIPFGAQYAFSLTKSVADSSL